MSKKASYDPAERAEAELEDAIAEMNAINEALSAGAEPDESDDSDDGQQADEDTKVSTQTADEDENSESYKSRWLSLQGQFKPLQGQIQELNRQNQMLLAEIDRLKAQPPAQQAAASTDVSITPDELESMAARITDQYGDDLGKPFEQLTKYIKKLEGDVKQGNQRAQETAQAAQLDKREILLTQLCPQWSQLNYDEGFIAWLGTKAPYSNKTLHQQLNASYDAGDMEGAAEIFNGYLKEQGKSRDSSDKRSQLQTPNSRSSAPDIGDSRQQKVWTEASVNAFYKSIQNNQYRGTEAEKAATESEIHRAYLEGRVR